MTNLKIMLAALFTAVMIIAGGGDVTAQVNPDIQLGSKIPVRPEKADPVRDGVVRDQFVRCSYSPYKEKVDVLLQNSDPITADFGAAGLDKRKMFRRDSLIQECLIIDGQEVQASISFSDIALRYMFLEAAYKTSHTNLPDGYADIVGAARTIVTTGTNEGLARSLGAFSDCLAAEDPVGAHAILYTGSGTSAEKEAAMAMVPALSACIMAGQELKLTPATIRTFAADGMWQRFVAPNTKVTD